jgi:hypothetical protein
MRLLTVAGCLLVLAAACADPEAARIKATTRATYDPKTGKLAEITYDRNKNGVIDTWTQMDGKCPVSSAIDTNEDGFIDRWEFYEHCGRLTRVGILRAKPDPARRDHATAPDEWQYLGLDGKVARIEYLDLLTRTPRPRVVRREFYEGGVLARVEEDTDHDGVMDRWETYLAGQLRFVELADLDAVTKDGVRDSRPKQRRTYDANGVLVLIESAPDAAGRYTKRTVSGKT